MEQLPDQEISAAGRYLEQLVEGADPFFKHLMDAPEDDEVVSERGKRVANFRHVYRHLVDSWLVLDRRGRRLILVDEGRNA